MAAGNGFTGTSPLFQSRCEIPLRISGVTSFHAADGSARVTAVRTKATSVRLTARRSACVSRTSFVGVVFTSTGSVPVGERLKRWPWSFGRTIASTTRATKSTSPPPAQASRRRQRYDIRIPRTPAS